MKKAVFEVAALQDAIAKANRIAPTKGAAHDRAAGIVIEVNPASLEAVVVKATDLDVTFRMNVNVLELGDESVTWRVPSQLMYGVVSTLPIGQQHTVSLRDNGDGNLYFLCGKTKAKLRLITGDYPSWEPFETQDLATVPSLARRLQQVAWAVDGRGTGVLSGIHLDGENLIACDRTNMAMVPCIIPLDEPVTAPLSEVASLIKNTSEVTMRATKSHVELMPDSWTQTTCILYRDPYPDIKNMMSKYHQTGEILVVGEELTSALDKMLVLVKSERMPTTTIRIGDGSMYLEMEVPDVGKIADEIEVVGGEPTDPFVVSFSPNSLKMALGASGREKVTIKYGPNSLSPIVVCDDNQFFALMMPIRK
jgi:DNA polymerase III sliding clamp (beta) subunit (PCNA family)